MKAMIFSDLVTMKNSLAQLAGIMVVVGIFISIGCQSIEAGVAAVGASLPFMYFFSVSAYDEMNGWEQFRLTLPMTRRQVAWGRYASMAIVSALSAVFAFCLGMVCSWGAAVASQFIAVPEGLLAGNDLAVHLVWATWAAICIILVAAAISMPATLRFGLTKGTRIIPVIVVVVLAAAIILTNGTPLLAGVEAWIAGLGPESLALVWIGVLAVVVILYLASALVAARLYERRQL